MHDRKDLVYLDLQKTGSTYVSDFLNESCLLPLKKYKQHARIGFNYKPSAFYFITVRHPFSYYRSLFRYGLDKRGALYGRLVKAGFERLYQPSDEGFNNWMEFILDASNAHYFRENFPLTAQKLDIGFFSHRYLMLSIALPLIKLASIPTKEELESTYEGIKITDHVIRQEQLSEGLLNLATKIKPELFNLEKAQAFLDKDCYINQSISAKELPLKYSPSIEAKLRAMDRLIFTHYDD